MVQSKGKSMHSQHDRNPGCGTPHDTAYEPTTHECGEGGMQSAEREAHQKKRMSKHLYHGTPSAQHSRNYEQRSE